MSFNDSALKQSNTIDLTILFASRITRSFAAGALAVAVPLYYKEALNLSFFYTGILLASGAFAAPILSYIFGLLGDRFGRKIVLFSGLAFLPISIGILIVTTYYPLLLLATAFGGFGVAGGLVGGGVGAYVAPMQTALLAEKSNKHNRTTVYTVFTMLSNFAGSLGALALVLDSNYKTLFYLALIFTLLSVILIIPLKETFKPEKSHKKTFFKNGNVTAQDKSIINKFVLTGIFNGLTQGLVTPFLPILFHQNFGLTNSQIGIAIAIGGILTTTAMVATPYLTRRFGLVNYIIASRSVSAMFVLYFPFSPSALIAVLSYWLFTISRAISLPSQMALMMNLVSERARSEASGTNQAARLFPLATSTTFSGDILDIMPLYVSFALAFMVSVVNILLYQKFFGTMEIDDKKARIRISANG